MSKLNFKKFMGDVQSSLIKHSPEILMGIGIAGMLTTTVLAVRATPKALTLIEMERKRQQQETGKRVEKIKPVDAVKVAWKCYVPSAIVCTTSVACLIGASSVHTRRNALLATAYKISESALTEYKEKVIETVGEKKEQKIRDEIAKDRIDKNPLSKNEIIVTGKGETMCYDHYGSGRYFKSDIDKIKKAVNELNARLLRDSYVSLNEFYDEIGLSGTEIGDTVGWRSDKGLIVLYFSAVMSDKDEPCLAIDFKVPPTHGYDKLY